MGTASGGAHIVLPLAYKLACAAAAHTLAVQGGGRNMPACVLVFQKKQVRNALQTEGRFAP